MVEFKKSVEKALPYNRSQYVKFLLSEDDEFQVKWYGASFQLHKKEKEISLKEFLEKYEGWFKKIISSFDSHSLWIVNHDKSDLNWFPNRQNNLSNLRKLFRENNVSNRFRGALVFSKDTLLDFSADIVSYPYAVFDEGGLFYMNLDISHSELPFIIKVLDHLNIDLLSTNRDLLKEVVDKGSSNSFIVKAYRGTSLI